MSCLENDKYAEKVAFELDNLLIEDQDFKEMAEEKVLDLLYQSIINDHAEWAYYVGIKTVALELLSTLSVK